MGEPGIVGVEPNQDYEVYLDMALLIASRKRTVGAVLVADGRVREIGWNGMELKGEETKKPLHAEFNVAENFRHSQRARNVEGWAGTFGIVIYSSLAPCTMCIDYADKAGIVLVWRQK